MQGLGAPVVRWSNKTDSAVHTARSSDSPAFGANGQVQWHVLPATPGRSPHPDAEGSASDATAGPGRSMAAGEGQHPESEPNVP